MYVCMYLLRLLLEDYICTYIIYYLIVRKPECDEVGSEVNTKAALEDVGHNADLYIAIQEDNMQN